MKLLRRFREQKNLKKQLYYYSSLIKESNKKLISLKHDLNNQLQVAYVIFKQDKEKAIEMLDKINENLSQIPQTQYCKNLILNTILAIKVTEAESKNIKVKVKIDNSIKFDMEDIDLCNLFTNLLDNSIEASENISDKNIEINIYKKLDYIIIKCENTYRHKIEKDENGKFKSTKSNKGNHGYGLKIIENIANKYNGEINIQTSGGRFVVMVVFHKQKKRKLKNRIKVYKKLENSSP